MGERNLELTAEQRAVARMLKERHGLPWPFAAIIARDVIALRVVDGSLSLPIDPASGVLSRRKNVISQSDKRSKFLRSIGQYNEPERLAALETARRDIQPDGER